MSLQKTFPLYLAAKKAVKTIPREEQTIAIKKEKLSQWEKESRALARRHRPACSKAGAHTCLTPLAQGRRKAGRSLRCLDSGPL